MSQQITNSFTRQYEKEVHVAYQRKGSVLRNTVRTANGVQGASTTFQKVGKGIAGEKDRHGLVPVMNVDHTPVEVLLKDFYAGDWADKLDLLKTDVDERQVLANAGAYALGRKTDDIILNAILAASTSIPHGSVRMTAAKLLAALVTLGEKDVPIDDGQVFAVIGYPEWAALMTEATFANADYVPANELPYAGRGLIAKRWSGLMVMPTSLIGADVNDISTSVVYHSSAIGHAIGQDVTADITWHGDHAAHFINNMMSMGAGLIDNDGVVKVLSDRSPA